MQARPRIVATAERCPDRHAPRANSRHVPPPVVLLVAIPAVFALVGVLWLFGRVWGAGADWMGRRFGCTGMAVWLFFGTGLVAAGMQAVVAVVGVSIWRLADWVERSPRTVAGIGQVVVVGVVALLVATAAVIDLRTRRMQRRRAQQAASTSPRP